MTATHVKAEPESGRRAGLRAYRVNIDWFLKYAAGTTLVVLLGVAAALTPAFYSGGNLRTVALQASVLGVVVLGQTVALLVRGLDMSVSAVVAFSGVLVVSAGRPGMVVWFLLLAVCIAVLVGLANGLLVTWRKVPAFVATFAMLIVVGGCRLAYTHGQTSGSVPPWLRRLGSGSVLGAPLPVVIWLSMLLVFWIALTRTDWGRWVYATGASPEGARHSGVPVGLVTVSAYVVCSCCAMVAGLLLSGYLGYVDQNLGVNVNLNSITAAIVGGVAFSGGRGGVLGATMGAVLLTVLVNVVVVAGLAVYWQLIAMGLVLVLAVAVQGLRDHWMPES
jgi:ribose/xylose/arabinose/galactoside ABC-type transport system permease subunit